MITIGIAAAAAISYLLGWFNRAFWILVFAICSGVLGTIRAVIDPRWYITNALMAGAEPNYPMLFGTKAVVLAILVPLAWYMGKRAGYF